MNIKVIGCDPKELNFKNDEWIQEGLDKEKVIIIGLEKEYI